MRGTPESITVQGEEVEVVQHLGVHGPHQQQVRLGRQHSTALQVMPEQTLPSEEV